MITGEELVRRVAGYENMKNSSVLSKYFGIGVSPEPHLKGHTQKGLGKIMKLAQTLRPSNAVKTCMYSAFTLLTEGLLLFSFF